MQKIFLSFLTALSTWWSVPFRFLFFFLTLLECERTDFKMNCLNEWTAEQLSVLTCSYLFSVCIMSWLPLPAPVDCAPALLAVMLVVVVAAHPLMSKLLICALPRLSAVCRLGCLSRLCSWSVWPVSVLPSNGCGLLLPWTTMHFRTPFPSPSPLKTMTGCCDDDFLLSCAPTSCLLRLWHPSLPMSRTNWWLPCRALSVIDCAAGNGVVHQNLGLLLTGTTSARSVSTRSRERWFPWATTPPSHRREY